MMMNSLIFCYYPVNPDDVWAEPGREVKCLSVGLCKSQVGVWSGYSGFY